MGVSVLLVKVSDDVWRRARYDQDLSGGGRRVAPDVEARIDADFPEGSRAAVRDILGLLTEGTVFGLMIKARDRALRCILYLAAGDPGRLAAEVDAALDSVFAVMRRAEWEGDRQVRDFSFPPDS